VGKAVEAVGGAFVDLIGGGLKFAFGLIGGVFGSLFQPEMPDMSSLGTGHQDLRTESNAPRLMIVGKTVTSGPITKYQKRTLNKKEYNLFFTPLAAHPCESVELYQLDGKDTSSLSGNGYRIQVALGDQTTANATARSEMTNVDEDCIGFGITYAYHKYEVNPDIFPNGVQDVKFLVAGIKCYDPRKDSSVGGNGDHRADDQSTWEWTENPVLINLYWKRFGGDEVLPIEMFDMANLAYEANLCDEVISFEDKNGDTHTEKRWTCNGVIDLSQGQRIVEDELLKSCGGRWVEAGGKYWLLTAAYRGPATVTLTEDDLKADVDRQPYTPLEDRCNAVVAKFIDPDSFYQETNSTEIFSEYYRDIRDKKYLQHARQLAFTNSDTMCQRSNRVYMERLAAGDTLKVVVGWKGIKCSPGKVVNIEFKEHNIIGKEYEVIDFDFDTESFTWTLMLQETTAEIYSDSVIPSERDLTPNTDIDNTYVSAPQNINYSPTPNDAWRQGILTWEHDAPESVRRYTVLITSEADSSFSVVYYPTQQTLDVNNLSLGAYTVAIAAENRFEKSSVAISRTINIGVTPTPTSGIEIQVLPGRVVITGPELPHDSASYSWCYSFNGNTQEDFDNAVPAGNDTSITITNTPHNSVLYVWYRILDGERSDPNWASLVIPSLIGINSDQFNPIEFAHSMQPVIGPLKVDIESLKLSVDDIDNRFVDFEAQTLSIVQQERISTEAAQALLLQSISENAAYQIELARRVEQGEELTNAVIYRDPSNGLIVNRAYNYADDKFTEASLKIDGVSGEVELASKRIENTEDAITSLSSELSLIPGIITAKATAIVSESISALEPAYAFNFFDSAQGWQAVNGTLTAGVNEITVTHGDIENNTLNYLASENKLIRVSLQRLSGSGWSGTVIIERDDSSVETYANYVEEASILLIDFSAMTSYTGTVTRVRLVLGTSVSDEFKISSISIGKADATTQDLANITARINAAELAINANEAEIAQRVSTSYFNENAITVSNVEQKVNALDTIIALEAKRQELIDNNVIQKAVSAATFLNGQTGTIQDIVQSFEQDIESVESSISDVQQQVNSLGITEQVAGLASQQIQTYDVQAALLQQAVNDLSAYMQEAETNESVALAVNQLQIDVSPEGALAKDIGSLQAVTLSNGNAITATNKRLSQVETDAEGNASAIEQLNLSVSGLSGNLTGALSRIDLVEVKANENAISLSAIEGRATNIEQNVEANFTLAQEAIVSAQNAASNAAQNASSITRIENDVSILNDDLTATNTIAQQAKATAESAEGKATTNTNTIQSISNAVNDSANGLSATNTIAQQAKTTAESAEGKATTNASAITGIKSTAENAESKAQSALTLLAEVNNELDEYRAVAQLAVDANGNAALIQLGATPDISEIIFKAMRVIYQNSNGVPKLFFDTEADDYVFGGTLRSNASENIGANYMELANPDGFGPDGLTYYYGPKFMSGSKPDYTKAKKANATQWRDTAGDSYFGGSLSAGVLSSSTQNPTIALNPTAEIGPFSTNGNSKTIAFSFYWEGDYVSDSACPTSPLTPTATLTLQRSIGGGSWSTLQTRTMSGSVETFPFNNDGEEGCNIVERASAAFTFTDPNSSMGTFSYRVVVSSQQRYLLSQFITRQILSIISTEE